MNAVINIDTQLFFAINHLLHNGLIDSCALFLSGIGEAGIVWFVIGAFLIFREESKDQRLFIPLGLTGGLVWSITELIIKPLIARLRPSSALDAATVIGGFPLGYSFPSTHATFAFALATVLSYIEPKWKKGLYVLALLISLSRIYLGHHYPGDVIVGGFLGWGIGYFVLLWYKRYKKQTTIQKRTSKKISKKSRRQRNHRYRRFAKRYGR